MTTPKKGLPEIRRAAPEWARWLCFSWKGYAWWQDVRGGGCYWQSAHADEMYEEFYEAHGIEKDAAIDLATGDVHLQDAQGRITVVPRREWEGITEGEG